MNKIVNLVIIFFTSLAGLTWAEDNALPACKQLEAIYIEIAKRAGESIPSQEQIQQDVYGENPDNETCKAMLQLFESMK